MDKNQSFSLCVRCGTPRVLLKRWKDHGENGKGTQITHEETGCPDKACQKVLDDKFQEMRDMRTRSEERKKNLILERSLLKKQKLAELNVSAS